MELDLARQQWLDGSRRIERRRDQPAVYVHLHQQVEVVIAELRRRLGQSFTLDELASEYAGADDWARRALDAAADEDAPPPEASTVADAAFHAYARGAQDYTP